MAVVSTCSAACSIGERGKFVSATVVAPCELASVTASMLSLGNRRGDMIARGSTDMAVLVEPNLLAKITFRLVSAATLSRPAVHAVARAAADGAGS